MKRSKILLVGTIAAVASVPAVNAKLSSSTCGKGGFYCGLNFGASFDKANVKIDKEKLEANSLTKRILEKLGEHYKTIEAFWAAKDMVVSVEKFIDLFCDVLVSVAIGEDCSTAYTTVDCIAGSLEAILKDTGIDDKLKSVLKVLSKYGDFSKSAQYKDCWDNKDKAFFIGIFKDSIKEIVKDKGFSAIFDVVGQDDGSNAIWVRGGNNIDIVYLYGRKVDGSDDGLKAELNDIDQKYQKLLKSRDEFIKVYRDAVEDSFATDAELREVFYVKKADGTFETDMRADSSDIFTKLTTYGDKKVKDKINSLGFSERGTASKKATGFLFEGMLGFDHRINNVVLGVDLTVGMHTGKPKIKTKDEKGNKKDTSVEVKKQFTVGLMPRIGYLVTPELELFLTAGGSLSRYKVDFSGLKNINLIDFSTKVADSLNKGKNSKDKDYISKELVDKNGKAILISHKKTKFVPVIGAGVNWSITPEIFARLAYNFSFKANLIKNDFARVKYSSHAIKAGIGFRF